MSRIPLSDLLAAGAQPAPSAPQDDGFDLTPTFPSSSPPGNPELVRLNDLLTAGAVPASSVEDRIRITNNPQGDYGAYAQQREDAGAAAYQDPAQQAQFQQRAAAGQQMRGWLDRNADISGDAYANTRQRFAADPYPADALQQMDPTQAAGYRRGFQRDFYQPMMEQAARPEPGMYVNEHLAAGNADLSAAGKAALAQAVPSVRMPYAPPGYQEMGDRIQQASDADLAQANYIREQLPQTQLGSAVTGGLKLGQQMAAGAALGPEAFGGMFAADAAGGSYAEGRNAGRDPQTAVGDAAFSGFKAFLFSKLPPILGNARAGIAEQVARAYVGNAAMGGGDAVVQELWNKARHGQDIGQEGWERVGQAALNAGVIGTAMHGGGMLMERGGGGAGGEKVAQAPAPEVRGTPIPGKDYNGVSPLRDRSIRPGLVGGNGEAAESTFGGESGYDRFPRNQNNTPTEGPAAVNRAASSDAAQLPPAPDSVAREEAAPQSPFGQKIDPVAYAEALRTVPDDVLQEQADFYSRALDPAQNKYADAYAEHFPNHIELRDAALAEVARRRAPQEAPADAQPPRLPAPETPADLVPPDGARAAGGAPGDGAEGQGRAPEAMTAKQADVNPPEPATALPFTPPEWMDQEDATDLLSSTGRRIRVGLDLDYGTIRKFNPPSGKWPYGSVVIEGPRKAEGGGKLTPGKREVYGVEVMYDRLRDGKSTWIDPPRKVDAPESTSAPKAEINPPAEAPRTSADIGGHPGENLPPARATENVAPATPNVPDVQPETPKPVTTATPEVPAPAVTQLSSSSHRAEAPAAPKPKPVPIAERRGLEDQLRHVVATSPEFHDDLGATRSEPLPQSQATVPDAPTSGRLDHVEAWARKKLEEMGSVGLRGGVPVDPIADTKRLALYGVIGAARIAKGAAKFVEWSKEIVKDLPELAGVGKDKLLKLFQQSRRLHGMDDATRAEHVAAQFTVPADKEKTLTRVRRLTGQVNTAQARAELDGLKAKLKAEGRGADAGYKQGVRDVTGLSGELARIIKENLPPSTHRQFLDDVAKVTTPGQMALAIQKGRRLLADHDVRETLSALEDLTGNLEVHVIRPPTPRRGEEKAPRVMGDVQPDELRTVDVKTLPKDVRDEVTGLIEKARYLKDRLRNAGGGANIEQKQKAVDDFRQIDQEVRKVVANHLADQEIRIGERLMTRDKISKEIVDKLGTASREAPRTSEAQSVRGEGAKRLFGRQALSMDAIATNMLGRDADAYKLTIDQVRQAQSDYYGEQRKTHHAFEGALEQAGIPAGSKKLDDWLTTRETVKLPDAGPYAMTRNEMLDIAATAADPQTADLIQRGVPWSFENHLRETPLKLTAKDVAAIRGTLKPEELALIDTFRQRNAEMTPAAMRAKINLTGSAPEAHEGYYPRSRNRMLGSEQGLPEGWRGYMDRALENVSSMKERAQDQKQPLRIKGFVGRVFDHFEDTSRLIHLAEPVRNVASVWQHPETARAVTRKYGESMNERINQFLRDTMMVSANPPSGVVGRAWERIARNVSRAWLQVNPSPMGKNVVGGTLSLLPEFEVKDWAAGVKSMFSPDVYKRMIEGSGVAWHRYKGGLYGAYSPLAGGKAETVAELSLPEALKAMKPGAAVDAIKLMSWADSVPLRAAWVASEKHVERTRPELTGEAKTQAVAHKFEEAVYRTQNGTSSTEISGFASSARGNPMLSAFLMFKSDSAKRYSRLAMMKDADAATRAKVLGAVALNALAAAGVGLGLRTGARVLGQAIGGKPADEGEKTRAKEAAVWNVGRDVAGIVPLGGLVTDVMRAANGKGKSDLVGNPVESTISGVADGVVGVGRALTKWADEHEGSAGRDKAYNAMMRQLWQAANATRTAAGDPTIPLTTLGKRVYDAATHQPPDPRDQKKKDAAVATKEFHGTLPAKAEAMNSEYTRLNAKGINNLTPAEKTRRAELQTIHVKRVAIDLARKQGRTKDAETLTRELEDAAKKVSGG